MMGYLTKEIGIDGMLISPGYQYSQIDPALTMTRAEHELKFRSIRAAVRQHGYRWLASPIYQDFLTGDRKLPCAPWGSITRNPYGWKGPCYLLTDGIFPTYEALLENIEWEAYGPGNDPRCEHCGDPLGIRAVGRVRGDREREADRSEHGVDADRIAACATSAEERAARRAGFSTARVGLGARLGVPAGRARLVRRRRRSRRSRGRDGDRRDTRRRRGGTRCSGRARGSASPARARHDPRRPAGRRRSRRATASARADRRRRGRHGERRARARRAGFAAAFARSATRPSARSARSRRPSGPTGARARWGSSARSSAGRRERFAPSRGIRIALAALGPEGAGMSGKVLLAAPRSFCAGVDRAIDIVEKLLEQHGPPIYVRHHIVHNDHVVRRLEELGAVFVDHEDEVPAGRDLRPLGARRRSCRPPELRASGPARRRRRLSARLEGARRGAALRRQRPPRRARRPSPPRRGDRDEGRAARPDRRRRVAGGGCRARDERQAARGDQPDDALARRRRRDRRRARRPLRRPPAARRRRHLLRDPEPAGRGEGDRLDGRDAHPRDRLADELERAAAGRGRAGARRAGHADRRRERASTTT